MKILHKLSLLSVILTIASFVFLATGNNSSAYAQWTLYPPYVSTGLAPGEYVDGQVGKFISLTVLAWDDYGDYLTMNAQYLPPGLKINAASCIRSSNYGNGTSTIHCNITGAPTLSGTFNAVISAKDNYNLSSSKIMPYVIRPAGTETQ